jgi:hypothetical protein
MSRTFFRVAGWLLFAAVVAVTVSPIGLRPQTVFGAGPERMGAFFLLGLLFGFGYDRRWLPTICLVVAIAFGAEALQLLVPSRHARFDDAAVKAVGGVIGVAVAYALVKTGWVRAKD